MDLEENEELYRAERGRIHPRSSASSAVEPHFSPALR
jgi:hypothetical protein